MNRNLHGDGGCDHRHHEDRHDPHFASARTSLRVRNPKKVSIACDDALPLAHNEWSLDWFLSEKESYAVETPPSDAYFVGEPLHLDL